MGVSLDPTANRDATGFEARISQSGSKIEVWVPSVDAAHILAEEALRLLPI